MRRPCDWQWELIRPYFPEENIPEGRPDRRPIPTRDVLDAALRILNTGAQWHMLPQCYPNYKTTHRRFQRWCGQQVLQQILTDLASALRDEEVIDERGSFIDASFSPANGGGAEIGPTKRGKGVQILAVVDRAVLPLSVSTHAANHHEVTLLQLSFDLYLLEVILRIALIFPPALVVLLMAAVGPLVSRREQAAPNGTTFQYAPQHQRRRQPEVTGASISIVCSWPPGEIAPARVKRRLALPGVAPPVSSRA